MESDRLANLSREDLVRKLQQAEQLVSLCCCTRCSATNVSLHLKVQGLVVFFVDKVTLTKAVLQGWVYAATKKQSPRLLAASARAAKGQ